MYYIRNIIDVNNFKTGLIRSKTISTALGRGITKFNINFKRNIE